MDKTKRTDALWELFMKTGLPEAYSLYRSEERKLDGRDTGEGDMPPRS